MRSQWGQQQLAHHSPHFPQSHSHASLDYSAHSDYSDSPHSLMGPRASSHADPQANNSTASSLHYSSLPHCVTKGPAQGMALAVQTPNPNLSQGHRSVRTLSSLGTLRPREHLRRGQRSRFPCAIQGSAGFGPEFAGARLLTRPRVHSPQAQREGSSRGMPPGGRGYDACAGDARHALMTLQTHYVDANRVLRMP